MISFALVSYLGVMSVTPGPNNLLLAASGVHFGIRRTIPHVLGISFGVGVQLFLTAVALSVTLQFFQGVSPWLAAAGCLYLLYLSWTIFRASVPKEREGRRPMGFFEAALFQAVNPKAWVMVVNTAILFTPKDLAPWAGALVLALVSSAVNLPCISVWALTGDRLRRFLATGRGALVFNTSMGILMAGTALWLLADELVLRRG